MSVEYAQPLSAEPPRLFVSVCFAFCVATLAGLAAVYWQNAWFIEPNGHGSPLDFINIWAAGRLVLDGQPAAAYDPAVHKQIEDMQPAVLFRRVL